MTDDRPGVAPAPQRLMSLDALRGFDMFWITGGESIIVALQVLLGWSIFERILAELHHPEWNGFTFYDLIFPLFLFIAGVAMSYSLTGRLETGFPKGRLYWRVIRRGLLLVLLGLIYQGLLTFDFAEQRYPSVLGRIGLAYLGAGLIVLSTRPRSQLAWVVGLLLGYWAAMMWIPVPGFGAGDLDPGHTLVDFIDRNLLPGHLYKVVRDPEGLFSTVPAVATALLGALTGHWLRIGRASGLAKAAAMFVAGLVLLGLGWLWNGAFPVNKNLWTSSFVLVTAGWSLMFLAVFYAVIDVGQYRKWALPFIVIGMNAITIYLAVEFIDFQALAALVLERGESLIHPALFGCAGFLLQWLLLFAMYRNKWFLRV
jgi:predicted acyltransferase